MTSKRPTPPPVTSSPPKKSEGTKEICYGDLAYRISSVLFAKGVLPYQGLKKSDRIIEKILREELE